MLSNSLKEAESEDENMRVYYSYIKVLVNVNQALTCEVPDRETVKVKIDFVYLEILRGDRYPASEIREYLEKIFRRIKYFIAESVFNRPSYFFYYIRHTKFKDKNFPDDKMISSNFDSIFKHAKAKVAANTKRKSICFKEIDEIITMDLSTIGFASGVIAHKSMYNPSEICEEFIAKLSKQLGHAYLHEHFFLWFEDYFKNYLHTMETLMSQDGFIPITWRYYIALMAASAMKSEYLFKTIEDAFLEAGGDEAWLIYGLDVIPEKLKKLSKINNLLAHQPWKIITEDIKELMNKRDQNDNTSWNLVEFMQAALIMVQYHKLAVITNALNVKLKCGGNTHGTNSANSLHVNEEINQNLLENGKGKTSNNQNAESSGLNSGIKDILIKNLENLNIEEENSFSNHEETTSDNKTTKKDSKKDNKIEWLDTEEEIKEELGVDSKDCLAIDASHDFDKHVNKYCNIYHDFDAHGDEFHSYLEFNWSDHGYYILKNLYPKGIDSFNSEIDYVTGLTTNSLGEAARQLNTFPIRYAISCYIEKILGYMHEDYDYANVNKLLVVHYKKFIKNVACYPKRLTCEDFDMMNYAFNSEEILHIILLVATVKCRTQLTYLASSLYEIIKTID